MFLFFLRFLLQFLHCLFQKKILHFYCRFATYQQQLQHDHLNSANAVTNNSVPSPATTQLIAQQSPALITQPRVILQSTYDHAPHSTPLTSPMVLSPATPSATPMVIIALLLHYFFAFL